MKAAKDRRETEEPKITYTKLKFKNKTCNSSEAIRHRIRLRIFNFQIIEASREKTKAMPKIEIKESKVNFLS